MGTGRKQLSIDEALGWRATWSVGDRSKIQDLVSERYIVRFEASRRGTYFHGKDAAGVTRMYVSPGFLEFPGGNPPLGARQEGDGAPFILLSTFKGHGAPSREADIPYQECPRHPGIALPASGRCDDCA